MKRFLHFLNENKITTRADGKYGLVTIDQEKGLGQTPNNQEIDYMGFTAMMKPKQFLRLAATREQHPNVEHIKSHIQKGGSIGSPQLYVNYTGKIPRVQSHEGRGRMKALHQLQSDVEIPVHIFPRHDTQEIRARHVTPEHISSFRKLVIPQDYTTDIMAEEGPHFGKAILQGKEIGDD